MITLDSVYFQAGSRVQCAARAVTSNGDEGLELSSPIVTISREEGEDTTMSIRYYVLGSASSGRDLVVCYNENKEDFVYRVLWRYRNSTYE